MALTSPLSPRHKIHPVGSWTGYLHRFTRPLPLRRSLSSYEICRQVWLLAGLKGLMLPLCEISVNVMMKLLMAFTSACCAFSCCCLILHSVTEEFLTISNFLHIENLIYALSLHFCDLSPRSSRQKKVLQYLKQMKLRCWWSFHSVFTFISSHQNTPSASFRPNRHVARSLTGLICKAGFIHDKGYLTGDRFYLRVCMKRLLMSDIGKVGLVLSLMGAQCRAMDRF